MKTALVAIGFMGALALPPDFLTVPQTLDHLATSERQFVASIEGLTPEQWTFKPAADRWSIAECAQHILLSEPFIRSAAEGALRGAATPSKVPDQRILALLVDRSRKFQSLEPLKPSGAPPVLAEVRSAFAAARAETVAFVRTHEKALRNSTALHPAFGQIDAQQWVLFLSGHTARHVAQIEEVKADPKFPKR